VRVFISDNTETRNGVTELTIQQNATDRRIYHETVKTISVGVGVGAAMLIGGGEKNVSLIPIALEGNTGLGAAAEIGCMSLKPAGI